MRPKAFSPPTTPTLRTPSMSPTTSANSILDANVSPMTPSTPQTPPSFTPPATPNTRTKHKTVKKVTFKKQVMTVEQRVADLEKKPATTVTVKIKDPVEHLKNRKRAFIAASRRSDRPLEKRIQSAQNASDVHFELTGKRYKITREIVENGDMYEDEDDRVPAQLIALTAHLQTNSPGMNRRVADYVACQATMSIMENEARYREVNRQFDQSGLGTIFRQLSCPGNPTPAYHLPQTHQTRASMQGPHMQMPTGIPQIQQAPLSGGSYSQAPSPTSLASPLYGLGSFSMTVPGPTSAMFTQQPYTTSRHGSTPGLTPDSPHSGASASFRSNSTAPDSPATPESTTANASLALSQYPSRLSPFATQLPANTRDLVNAGMANSMAPYLIGGDMACATAQYPVFDNPNPFDGDISRDPSSLSMEANMAVAPVEGKHPVPPSQATDLLPSISTDYFSAMPLHDPANPVGTPGGGLGSNVDFGDWIVADDH